MILSSGQKVLVCHRHLFAEDAPHLFAGHVMDYENGIARVVGYSWSRDTVKAEYVRKRDMRTKLVSIHSGMLLFYVLPDEVNMNTLEIRTGIDHHTVLTDGSGFTMDISERAVH